VGDPLRVALADDHYLVREGIRGALEDSGDVEVVAAVDAPGPLEEAVERLHPDVVVTDIRMPPTHTTEGIDLAHRVRAAHPDLGVVVLSQYAEAAYALQLLGESSAGLAYLLKERIADPAQLLSAVREVATGGSVVDPDVVAALVRHGSQPSASPLSQLTDREREVLEQMARGRTNASVAAELHLSESSVEKYSSAIFAKLHLTDEPQVHRRVAAVLTYLRDAGRARGI
jgi:DNA-binding NarL/FixJ family response regulator